jgi:elongin-A
MQIERDSEELKAKLKCIKDEKAKHTSRLLDPSEVPRTAGQKRKAAAATSRNQSTSTLTFGSGSRTKTTTGASILKKAAREAKEMHLFGARALLSTPSNQLKSKTSRVQSAPRGITQAYQSKAQPVLAQPNGILSQAELERRKQARVAKASSSLPPPIQEPRSHSPRSSSSAGVKRESTGSPKYVGTTQPSDSVENSDLPRRPIKVARTKTSFFTSLSNRGKSAQIIPPKPRIKTVSSPSRKEPPTSLDAPLSPTASLFSPPPSPSLSASPLPSSASSNGSREASSRGRTPHLSPGGPRPRQSVSPVKKIRRAQQTDPMLRRPPNAAKRRIGA